MSSSPPATAPAAPPAAGVASSPDDKRDDASAQTLLIISISGPSSSGKTSVSRLLRDLFAPALFILHLDDFFKTESECPPNGDFVDWDCAEALDIPRMAAVVAHIRAHGTTPPWFTSVEDQNITLPHGVPDTVLATLRARIKSSASALPQICLAEGFLLYTPAFASVTAQFDARLFLPASREKVLTRRAARVGYVTAEGFFTDPPGYVEHIVWPNYARDHAWLFSGAGDVDRGVPDRRALDAAGIQAVQGEDVPLEKVLEWAVERVLSVVEAFGDGREGKQETRV